MEQFQKLAADWLILQSKIFDLNQKFYSDNYVTLTEFYKKILPKGLTSF